MADVAEASPVKKQKIKKNKDTAPATEPKKKSKRKSVDAGDAPNTAPEAARKRKKKEVQPEEAVPPAVGKEPKKKKRRAAAALEGVGSAPEHDGGMEAQAGSADVDSREKGAENGPIKKPKTQQAEAAAGPEEGRQGKKRRRRGKKVGEEESLPPEERARRQRQRELRALALQMRGEGKAYKRPPQKKAKVEPAGAKPGKLYSAGRLQEAAQQADEEGSRPDHPVQVIVVPIFWNRKPEEKAQVIRAAEAVVKLLEAAGLTTGADTTNAMSPGQKFAYWEGQGVMVRIECGPRDAQRRECVLAISKKAGEVAERQTIPVGPKLVKSVGKALGVDVTLPSTAKAAQESNASEGTAGKAAGVKGVGVSGDDLGGDFGDLTVADGEGSKKKRRK